MEKFHIQPTQLTLHPTEQLLPMRTVEFLQMPVFIIWSLRATAQFPSIFLKAMASTNNRLLTSNTRRTSYLQIQLLQVVCRQGIINAGVPREISGQTKKVSSNPTGHSWPGESIFRGATKTLKFELYELIFLQR